MTQRKHINMKKHNLFLAAVLCLFGLLTAMPVAVQAQTTQGQDFWVTLMRSADDDPEKLSITVAAKNAATVHVENTTSGLDTTFQVAADGVFTLDSIARQHCYVGTADNEKVSQHALHVTATSDISLIAANYRDKSFDVAAILPTPTLMSEYRVQCYSPSVHSDSNQGSHFAIVATEDNTIVDYVLTAKTESWNNYNPNIIGSTSPFAGKTLGVDTFQTPVLQKGDVYYVWTGAYEGDAADLSGTWLKARDNKKIAVFNGNSHTNLPYKVKDRDQIYSQAMPIEYWGTQFAIMSSLTTIDNGEGRDKTSYVKKDGFFERIDKIRVMALEDGTTVYIDGDSVYTFDFSKNPKHYYEFDFGAKDNMTFYKPNSVPYYEGVSHFVSTSCPSAVHMFFTSNQYDHHEQYDSIWNESKNRWEKGSGPKWKYCNGDPALLWVNPIEQRISDITFSTFETQQVRDHFINIVVFTADVASVTLDGEDISDQFAPLNGDASYSFARLTGIPHGTHTLHANNGFIANVYGFGQKESYAYPAGAYAKVLTQYITINGEQFSPNTQNTLCGKDIINFACDLNYDIENITWCFGDGSANEVGADKKAVDHYYAKTGVYPAYVLIERLGNNLCSGQNKVDSIPITVTIGKLEFKTTDKEDDICATRTLVLHYENTGTALTNNNTTLSFNQTATANGFTLANLRADFENSRFVLTVPENAEQGDGYEFTVNIATGCGDTTAVVQFSVPYDPNKLLDTRWNDVMAVRSDDQTGYHFVAYQWFRNNDTIPGETGPSLSLNGVVDTVNTYFVSMWTEEGTEISTCPKKFGYKAGNEELTFEDKTEFSISSMTVRAGEFIYVSTKKAGTAKLYEISGTRVGDPIQLTEQGGYVRIPGTGLYLLQVEAGKQKRTFKILSL